MATQKPSGKELAKYDGNAAIIARWSKSALLWIKEQAWSGKAFE